MKYPKITIITPSFNQGHFIEQTLDSVLSQQYPNLEYLIFDGGSSDNSVEIIRKYEKYLTYWTSEKDRGQSHAINKGLQRATGILVNWLNSDDYYEKDTLFKVAAHFEDENTKVVCGRSRIFSEVTDTHFYSSGTDVYPDNLAKTIGWARIDQPETFFRLTALKKMGLLNEKLHYVMDKEWWMRYLLNFGLSGIVKTEDIFVNFRLHDSSKSVTQKQLFLDETHSLFYSLAVIFEHTTEKKVLEQTGNTKLILNKAVYENFDAFFISNVLHYYLLYLADYFYAQNDRQKARLCLNGLNSARLSQADKKLVVMLMLKMNAPVWMTESLRKLLHLLG